MEEDEFTEEPIENGEPSTPLNYGDLVTVEDEREINLEDYEPPKTLSEEEEETQQITDFRAAVKAIKPKFMTKRQNDLLQPIMMGRTFPDNYLDLNYFLTMSMVEEQENEKDIDFISIVTGNQVATSISYEGRHIIDIEELFGVSRDQEMDELSKKLGMM